MQPPFALYLADLLHVDNVMKTFPYAAGCVGAHAAAVLGERVRIEIFRSPEDLADAFHRAVPRVLGLTNYLWNLELGYEIVQQAKAAHPDLIVVMGGPNYPIETAGQRAFFERYPLVDFHVFKEGEIPFVELLEDLLAIEAGAREFKKRLRRRHAPIAGVHYFDGDEFVAPPPDVRQRDLDSFSSPYLSGLLDKFFARPDLSPLIQTKRGCPFECTFCVEGEAYYTKLGSVTTLRFEAELEYIARRMRPDGSPMLYIADSNFGMYEHDLEICDVIARVRERTGWPGTIEVSTGKNRKERVLEAVRRTQGAMRFGPALQSTDPRTLEYIKRSNISDSILVEMAAAAEEMGQRSFTELILGLPGDTADAHLRSIRAAMDAAVQRVKMYTLVLLPGTEMASEASRQRFGLRTRYRVLPFCRGSYRFLGEPFAVAEVCEIVIATDAMTVEEYLACKRFELSVEIFYNDVYLHEIHGLARILGLSMFEFVRRCHERLDRFPRELQALYDQLEHGVRDFAFDSREACENAFRDTEQRERFLAEEYQNSLGALKALALLEHIEPLLTVARAALWDCVEAAGLGNEALAEYVDELIEYSRLRRRRPLDTALRLEAIFSYEFDRIQERDFRVEPQHYRLAEPRRMRFWHDEAQTRDIARLSETIPNRIFRARSFIYPKDDPGVNPYLRRAAFC